MSTKLCHCRCGPDVVAVASPRQGPEELEYAEEEVETTETSSSNSSYHEAPVGADHEVVDRTMGASPTRPILIHRDESARLHVPSCCQALPTPSASQLTEIVEEIQARVSMPVEQRIPEGIQGLRNLISWQEARRRFLGQETVCTIKTKSDRKFTEGRRSTGISLGNRRFHPYHLSAESKLRRGFRRAERDLSGYESSSESGTSGLSCDSERGDGRYAHARQSSGAVKADLGAHDGSRGSRSSSRVD